MLMEERDYKLVYLRKSFVYIVMLFHHPDPAPQVIVFFTSKKFYKNAFCM